MESLCSKHGIGDEVTAHKNADDDKCEVLSPTDLISNNYYWKLQVQSHYSDIKTGSVSVEERIEQL